LIPPEKKPPRRLFPKMAPVPVIGVFIIQNKRAGGAGPFGSMMEIVR
jgi:hypothetical protein